MGSQGRRYAVGTSPVAAILVARSSGESPRTGSRCSLCTTGAALPGATFFGAAFFGAAFFGAAFFGAAFFGAAFFGAAFCGAAFFGTTFFDAAFFGAVFFGAALFVVRFAPMEAARVTRLTGPGPCAIRVFAPGVAG